CATAAELEGVSGKFFDSRGQPMPDCKLARNEKLAQELWERSCLWTGCDQSKSSLAQDYYDPNEGIWGVYSLDIDAAEMADITQNIFEQVLPKVPNKFLLLNLAKFLFRLEFGSLILLLIQYGKRQFHMERHLDAAAVQKLCKDPALLQQLKAHLGEDLLLWRSELWANYPSQQLIPFWHQDIYPKLLKGNGKSLNVYIALTEINEFNGFEYIPNDHLPDRCRDIIDPFSGNHFFNLTNEVERNAIPVVLRPGEFVIFDEHLVHRSIRNTSGKVRLSLTLRVTQSGMQILPGYTPTDQPPVWLSRTI
ncbi:MAG TPA: phytanoyl-CoA dioxygenase family protein, partial [Coleofasciculaceae cyanobacterium]